MGHFECMPDDRNVALRLDLQPDAEPIRGRIANETGEIREFVGWLGLANALERIVDSTGARPTDTEVSP